MIFRLIINSPIYKCISYKYKRMVVKNNPDREIIRCYKKAYRGLIPNLARPRNMIEKIYWLEWNTDTSLWTKCADKYRVREYLRECGLSSIAPKLLAKWDRVEDIDFSSLPNEFILKTNDGCGTNYIVRNKNVEDLRKIKKLFRRYMKIKIGYSNAQYHYLEIKPCIIAEELLHQSEELNSYSPRSLVDYKFFCINGVPECINLLYDRNPKYVINRLYDTEWNEMPEKLISSDHMQCAQGFFPKPSCLNEMLDYATRLSQPFPIVRVDFYVINEKPVFGELTFTCGYGDFTEEYINYLGDKIDLSRVAIIDKKDKIKKLKNL